jgi:N4-gp56 family major capsid protein
MATFPSVTTSLTTTLTQEMATYYDKVFLERAIAEQQYSFLTEGSRKSVPKNSGKSVCFTRQTAFTPTSAALTEGTTPTATPFSATTVSATLAEYGDFDTFSSFFEVTGIDAGLQEKVETMGQYAGEKMDTVLLYSLVGNGTAQYVGAGGLTGIGSTDTMSVAELRKAIRTLKINKAPKFGAPAGSINAGGAYRAVVNSYGYYSLLGDSNTGAFTSVNLYTQPNSQQVKDASIKRIAGVDIVETNNIFSSANGGASSTDTVYRSYVSGKGAVGEVDLAGSSTHPGSSTHRIIYKRPSQYDTSNPLDMFSTLAWKVDAYAAKVLNSSWLIEVFHR